MSIQNYFYIIQEYFHRNIEIMFKFRFILFRSNPNTLPSYEMQGF